jgi:Phage tail assembly chaperone proteins, E, or 41 or 14
MSEPATVRPFREGFIDPKTSKTTEPQPEPKPATQAMPPPELEPALSEQDTAPEIVQEKWPIVVKLLYKPLTIPGGQTLHEISFREPRAGDINRHGNPCRVNWEGEVLIEERKMHAIMAQLSGIQPPILELLDPRDWNSCAFRLRLFFAPDLRAYLSEPTKA